MSSNNVIGSLSKALNTGEFEWVINLSDEILETEGYLKSPTFSFSHGSWYVKFYPKGISNSEYISLYLKKKENQSEIYVAFSLEMTLKGKCLNKRESEHIFKDSEIDWGWCMFVLRKHVLGARSANDCNQLTIKTRMSDNDPAKKDPLFEKQVEGVRRMHQNFNDLLFNGKGHDLILKVKDREFKVHQNIMQCRSPVFMAMLNYDMLEKNEGVVEIPDCDPLAFDCFLIYVYTGNIKKPNNESMILGLYYIADKYDMACLKELCCEHIKKSLSAQNIGDVIKLALNHNDSSLLECGKKYYVDNVKDILVSKEWQSFFKENPNLVNEFFLNWS